VNHLPFEEWLLNDMPVSPEQQRELESHLRNCSYCASLADTGRLLRTARMASPLTGFTERFQARLAEHKIAERRRVRWGTILFGLGGLVVLLSIVSPYLVSFTDSPATWILTFVNLLVFLGTTLFALLNASLVILSVIPNFLPPFAWMVLLSTLAGMMLLWSVSIWRFVRVPQGV